VVIEESAPQNGFVPLETLEPLAVRPAHAEG
jgi:hypothetical protein